MEAVEELVTGRQDSRRPSKAPLMAVAVVMALTSALLAALPANAAPTANSRCMEGTFADPRGDVGALDIIRVDVWSDCRRFYFEVTTADAWNNGALAEYTVEIDLDNNDLTGCHGIDAIAIAIWDPALKTFRAATIITSSCDVAEWYNNGQGNVERASNRVILMHIGKNTLMNHEAFTAGVSLQRRNSNQVDGLDVGPLEITNPSAPAAPGAPTVNVVGGEARVGWNRPTQGDGPIEDYDIQYRFADGQWRIHFRDPATPTGTTTTNTAISGVSQGQWIEVRIRAVNDYGYGPWSTTGQAGEAPPMCEGIIATIVGTPERDVLRGTPGNDVMVGLDGNDVLFGLGGYDILCGDNGKDRLFGGDDDDFLFGGKKNDILKGDRGMDYIFGQRGNDRAFGGPQGDHIEGGSGPADRLFGKGGFDVCLDPQTATTRFDTCEQLG